MGSTYKQKGDVLDHTAGGAIAVNEVVVMGDIVGVANVALATGEEGAVSIEGVFQVTKVAGTAWSQGDKLDFDGTAEAFDKGLTAGAGDVATCAVAAAAAGSAATTGLVKLTPGSGAAGS